MLEHTICELLNACGDHNFGDQRFNGCKYSFGRNASSTIATFKNTIATFARTTFVTVKNKLYTLHNASGSSLTSVESELVKWLPRETLASWESTAKEFRQKIQLPSLPEWSLRQACILAGLSLAVTLTSYAIQWLLKMLREITPTVDKPHRSETVGRRTHEAPEGSE